MVNFIFKYIYIFTTAGLLNIENNTYETINEHSIMDTKIVTFLFLYHFD